MNWADVFEDAGHTVRWRVRPSNRIRVGDLAECKARGYYVVRYNGTLYKVHRVLWELRHGPIPEGFEIDHADGNPANNADDNLRLATRAQQTMNTALRADNSTGVRGVSFDGFGYEAYVNVAGKRTRRRFRTLAQAEAWVVAERREQHKEFAR